MTSVSSKEAAILMYLARHSEHVSASEWKDLVRGLGDSAQALASRLSPPKPSVSKRKVLKEQRLGGRGKRISTAGT